jgi:hypothetical protein
MVACSGGSKVRKAETTMDEFNKSVASYAIDHLFASLLDKFGKIKEVSKIEFPKTVKSVIKARVGRLDDECQNVLTLASLLGTISAMKRCVESRVSLRTKCLI